MRGLRFNTERMAAAAGDGLTVATDVAEQLVRDGVPFREAHRQVAARVAAGERFDSPTAVEAAAAAAVTAGARTISSTASPPPLHKASPPPCSPGINGARHHLCTHSSDALL